MNTLRQMAWEHAPDTLLGIVVGLAVISWGADRLAHYVGGYRA